MRHQCSGWSWEPFTQSITDTEGKKKCGCREAYRLGKWERKRETVCWLALCSMEVYFAEMESKRSVGVRKKAHILRGVYRK